MAVVDYFLKIEGIQGESQDFAHKGEFEITDFSFGVETKTTIGSATGGAGAGKVKFNEFTIKKTTDSASPVFFQKCAAGVHIREAALSVRKAGEDRAGQEFLHIKMNDVLVSSYQISGRRIPDPPPVDGAVVAPTDNVGIIGPEVPIDDVALSFATATVSSQATHIVVRPGVSGMLRFNRQTNSFDVVESPNGVLTVGTVNGGVTRGIQEFDVAILIGLLTNPFSGSSIRLITTEIREAATPPGDVVNAAATAAGAEPHLLHFDVFLYTPADGVLDVDDLTRKGKRIGRITVDPNAPPTTLTTDLTNLIRRRRLGTFGIRLQLRGAHLPELNEDQNDEDDDDVEHARGDGEEKDDKRDDNGGDQTPPADVSASFTFELVLDTA